MLLLLLNYVVLRALWKIDVHLISTLVNKSLYSYYYNRYCAIPVSSFMMNDDSPTHIPFPIIHHCPRNNCWFCLSEDCLNATWFHLNPTYTLHHRLNSKYAVV